MAFAPQKSALLVFGQSGIPASEVSKDALKYIHTQGVMLSMWACGLNYAASQLHIDLIGVKAPRTVDLYLVSAVLSYCNNILFVPKPIEWLLRFTILHWKLSYHLILAPYPTERNADASKQNTLLPTWGQDSPDKGSCWLPFDDGIKCDIQEATLSDPPPSYPSLYLGKLLSEYIDLKRQSFCVTHNLAEALRRLRQAD